MVGMARVDGSAGCEATDARRAHPTNYKEAKRPPVKAGASCLLDLQFGMTRYAFRVASTRSGVNGRWRSRFPVSL
jgi:hypothetical protein